MASLAVTVRKANRGRRVLVEMDAGKFERMAANFGFFNPAFLKSLDRAEKEYRSGRIRTIASLRELRK